MSQLERVLHAYGLDDAPITETVTGQKKNRQGRVTTLSEVRSKRMRLLWKDLGLPLGVVAIFAGRGGTGKSTFTLWMSAQLNRGLLSGDLHGEPAHVMVISHEDPLDSVLVPRVDANGADRDRIHHFAIESEDTDGVMVPKLPIDLPAIRVAIVETGSRLVIFDPITSALEGDNDKVRDVRAMLDPLAVLAEELDITVICIAHFRKGATGSASDFTSGSHAYRDAARVMVLFAEDHESGDTVVSVDKGNYGETRGNFSFHLESTVVPTDDGDTTTVGRVVFTGVTSRTVAEVMAADGTHEIGEKRSEILAFIRSAPTVVSATEVETEFPEMKRTTIRSNLTRLVQSGDLMRVGRGQYAPAKPVTQPDVAPQSRVAISATSATSASDIAHIADVAPLRAREARATTNPDGTMRLVFGGDGDD